MPTEDRVYAQYFQDVRKARMPANAEEERQLFERYLNRGDSDARRRIVEGGLRFVIKTAKHYYRGDSDYLKTLIAAGNVGLLVAVDRYRPWVIRCPQCHKNNYVSSPKYQRCNHCHRKLRASDAEHYTTRFLTYAAWWISEAIRTELYNSSLIHTPPYKQKEQHKACKEGRGDSRSFSYVPFDDSSDDQPTVNLVEVLTDMHAQQLLYHMLDKLSVRHAFVIMAYYGLREEPKTHREIAAKLDVCSERVRQIKVDAMLALKEQFIKHGILNTEEAYAN